MLKVMTLWEPWASLLAIEAKKVETRHWHTEYRGPVAIHAAKGGLGKYALYDTCTNPYFITALSEFAPDYRFHFGHIIAVGILSDCVPTEIRGICDRELFGEYGDYKHLDTPQERAFGNYAPGRFGFVFTDVARLKSPIPFKSRQGKLLDLDRDTELAVRAQWWQRCCPCPAESHSERTHEVERGEHYCKGCNSIHDYREESHCSANP